MALLEYLAYLIKVVKLHIKDAIINLIYGGWFCTCFERWKAFKTLFWIKGKTHIIIIIIIMLLLLFLLLIDWLIGCLVDWLTVSKKLNWSYRGLILRRKKPKSKRRTMGPPWNKTKGIGAEKDSFQLEKARGATPRRWLNLIFHGCPWFRQKGS